MITSDCDLIRQKLPKFEVYVQAEDRSLALASNILADDVRADLAQIRNHIIDAFGDQTIPDLCSDTARAVSSYFSAQNWTLPQSVMIDPSNDALLLRKIFKTAQFRSKSDEESFTGDNKEPISPGGSSAHDLVIFHDWRDKYRADVQEVVERWGYAIDEQSLARTVELKIADFTVHELSHLAGGLAVAAVAVEKADGKYCLADRVTGGFTDIHDDIPVPSFENKSGYYTGSALDESWAAWNASRFILTLNDYDCPPALEIADRYNIRATLKFNDGQELYHPVSGLHSGEAGMIIEKLDEIYPSTLSTMTEVADGKIDLRTGLDRLSVHIPADMMKLLSVPQFSAWQTLISRLSM